jgi:hypothetical protein
MKLRDEQWGTIGFYFPGPIFYLQLDAITHGIMIMAIWRPRPKKTVIAVIVAPALSTRANHRFM